MLDLSNAVQVLSLGVLTVWSLGWNQNKPMKGQVSGSFTSSEQWNCLWWYWFQYYLRLDMTLYDLVSQLEHSFVLRTKKSIFICASSLVLLELARTCDVFKGWFSVANYQLESQCKSVNYLFIKHFFFCLDRDIIPLSQYYFVSKRYLCHCDFWYQLDCHSFD
jgi:hypothetical protein